MGLPNIGLCGYMRSGKDTIADYLIEHHGYTRLSFAGALKEEVARGIGCSPADLNVEPLRSQVRPVLQVWGTEFRRAQDSTYWIAQAEAKIIKHESAFVCEACGETFSYATYHDRYVERGEGPFLCRGKTQPAGPIVFTDTRFHNEIDMLRGRGFVIIKLDMTIEDVLAAYPDTREETLAHLTHPSEREWQGAGFDVVIPSRRGDIQELYDAIERVLSSEVSGASA